MQRCIGGCEYKDGHLSEQDDISSLEDAPDSTLVFKLINSLNTAFDHRVLDTCLPCKSKHIYGGCVDGIARTIHNDRIGKANLPQTTI